MHASIKTKVGHFHHRLIMEGSSSIQISSATSQGSTLAGELAADEEQVGRGQQVRHP
jgi:hypothetical protein